MTISKEYLDKLCKDIPDWKGWTGQDWSDFWYSLIGDPYYRVKLKSDLADLFELCIRINYERGLNESKRFK